MANFSALAHDTFLSEERSRAVRTMEKINAITTGSKVLVWNSRHRRNEWKTVSACERQDGSTIARFTMTDNSQFWAEQVLIVATPQKTETLLISLADRQKEFVAAIKRGADNDLDVYPDWELDSFVVVNRSAETEYRVTLRVFEEKVLGDCECADFRHRNRVCKHLAAVLGEMFFSILPRLQNQSEVAV